MRGAFLILLMLMAWLPAGRLDAADTNASPRQAVVFRNGDLLFGSLIGIQPQEKVQWRHSGEVAPFELSPSGITEIHLGQRAPKDRGTNQMCLVRLTNLDELEGELVSLDAKELVLKTWYAGKVVIPRPRVDCLLPLPGHLPVVFTGPTGLDGWTMGKVAALAGDGGQWSYRDEAFYATESSAIARDLKLPDLASLEFDLAWQGALNFAVALYTDHLQPVSLQNRDGEPAFGPFYSLQINNSQVVNLLAVSQQNPIRYLGQALVPALAQKNRMAVSVRMNKSQRTITLLLDGTVVKQWIDPEAFSGSGTAVRFVHQGNGSLKLDNIRVLEWDGRFEERPVPTGKSDDDVAALLNRDKVMGTLKEIRDGKAKFTVGSSALDIPLERVQQLDLADNKSVRGDENGSDVRVYFARRGSLTFQLEHWDEKKVIARSANFGRLEFDARAFSRLQFLK